ncbi:hypothetical protein [Synechococcus lacustris]|uniref:hypothetical protein n=1 Tax=Synechococcus lacustris TaxID=2116544 RepID=UPI00333F23F7
MVQNRRRRQGNGSISGVCGLQMQFQIHGMGRLCKHARQLTATNYPNWLQNQCSSILQFRQATAL